MNSLQNTRLPSFNRSQRPDPQLWKRFPRTLQRHCFLKTRMTTTRSIRMRIRPSGYLRTRAGRCSSCNREKLAGLSFSRASGLMQTPTTKYSETGRLNQRLESNPIACSGMMTGPRSVGRMSRAAHSRKRGFGRAALIWPRPCCMCSANTWRQARPGMSRRQYSYHPKKKMKKVLTQLVHVIQLVHENDRRWN